MERPSQEKPKPFSKEEAEKIEGVTPEFREAVKEKRWPTSEQVIEDVHLKAETDLLEGVAPIEKSRPEKKKRKEKTVPAPETHWAEYEKLYAIERKLVSEFKELTKHQGMISLDKQLPVLNVDREFTEGCWGLDNIHNFLIKLYNQNKEKGNDEKIRTILNLINESLEIKIFLLQEEIARLKEQLKKEE